MKNLWVVPILFAASQATGGGWEASTLDTSFMYQEGNDAEVGTASVTYNVKATTQANTAKTKMAKNQSRTGLAFKMDYGNFDIGLASYMSGAILLSGKDAHAAGCNPVTAAVGLCSVVPSADVKMNSLALLGRYKLGEEFSILAGANRYELGSGAEVNALLGDYVVSGDAVAPTFGAAYEKRDIALRVELVVQSKTKISNFKAQSKFAANGVATTLADVTGESMTIPQSMKLNFQSGIAEGTLLFGTIHQANWKDAQIGIPAIGAGSAGGNRVAHPPKIGEESGHVPATEISSDFQPPRPKPEGREGPAVSYGARESLRALRHEHRAGGGGSREEVRRRG